MDMEPYFGDIGSECRNYLRWMLDGETSYYQMDNPCADIALHLLDCDGVDLCAESSENCLEILARVEHRGIIGRSAM